MCIHSDNSILSYCNSDAKWAILLFLDQVVVSIDLEKCFIHMGIPLSDQSANIVSIPPSSALEIHMNKQSLQYNIHFRACLDETSMYLPSIVQKPLEPAQV